MSRHRRLHRRARILAPPPRAYTPADNPLPFSTLKPIPALPSSTPMRVGAFAPICPCAFTLVEPLPYPLKDLQKPRSIEKKGSPEDEKFKILDL